jgi:transposase InsO family protein
VSRCAKNWPAPNRKWIADLTYVWTAEGWLYVSAVVDLADRLNVLSAPRSTRLSAIRWFHEPPLLPRHNAGYGGARSQVLDSTGS